jgi:antitoxin (DNA-binding transcriptional repressor) of toxin-antitoxin stability system
MHPPVVTISVTQFKAKCLALFDELEGHKVAKVVVTRHGKPVAELTPPATDMPPLFGAHRGSVSILGDADLTQPTFDENEFEAGAES